MLLYTLLHATVCKPVLHLQLSTLNVSADKTHKHIDVRAEIIEFYLKNFKFKKKKVASKSFILCFLQ